MMHELLLKGKGGWISISKYVLYMVYPAQRSGRAGGYRYWLSSYHGWSWHRLCNEYFGLDYALSTFRRSERIVKVNGELINEPSQ